MYNKALLNMQTTYFRINKKEYCHINDEYIFIVNTKDPTRIPLAFELGEGWGIMSVLNYIVFAFLFIYTAMAITFYGFEFFIHPINYGALILLLVSFVRVKEGFLSSRTPMIERKKIKNVLFKSPKFSFPRVVIYFEGPEGKTLRRIIPVLYKKEALPVLESTGLI
jgi:hypothetical protein